MTEGAEHVQPADPRCPVSRGVILTSRCFRDAHADDDHVFLSAALELVRLRAAEATQGTAA